MTASSAAPKVRNHKARSNAPRSLATGNGLEPRARGNRPPLVAVWGRNTLAAISPTPLAPIHS